MEDGKTVSLHRFPADEKVSSVWKKRCSNALKKFVLTVNSRLCSEHFSGRSGPKLPYISVPSIFPSKTYKTTMVCEADKETVIQGNESIPPRRMLCWTESSHAVQSVPVSDDLMYTHVILFINVLCVYVVLYTHKISLVNIIF